MNVLLKAAYLVFLLAAIVGAINAAYSIVGLYMVVAGNVQPGEPMYLDELAPTGKDALIALFVSVVVIAFALAGCWRMRRRLNNHANAS
jgi:hypothetical protein